MHRIEDCLPNEIFALFLLLCLYNQVGQFFIGRPDGPELHRLSRETIEKGRIL